MVTKPYTAEKICKNLKNQLSSPQEMKVHSIFDTALNLSYKNGLVTIIPSGKPLYPNSILLKENISFLKDMDLYQGMVVTVDRELLIIADKAIGLQEAEEKVLHVNTLLLEEPKELDKRIAVLKDVVVTMAHGEGLSPLVDEAVDQNVYSSFLKPRIEEFLAEILSGNIDKVLRLTEGIAGCGMGLTPSSDDFLCGLMGVLLGNAIVRNTYDKTLILTKGISAHAIPKTGIISAEFLKSSGNGYLSEDSLELIVQIYSKNDLQQLRNAALNVARFGATSGTDILTGVILALKTINNY